MSEPPVMLTRDSVVTPEQVREALQLSPRQWARVRHRLLWSYAFGERCPRIVWGQVLDVITSGALEVRRIAPGAQSTFQRRAG